MVVPVRRKAQFFIITAVLVAGSLSATVAVLEDYSRIDFDQMTTDPDAQQFTSFAQNLDEVWYDQSWTYRSRIAVGEVSGRDIDSYPLSFQIDTAQLIDDGKLQPDCADLRVVDGMQELPYQIEEGECGTANTTVWFLASLNANQNEDDFFVYYGNEEVEQPSYDTGLEYDDLAERLENNIVTFQAGSRDGWYGFVRAERSGADANNIAANGTVIYREPAGAGNDLELVSKEGPVFATVSFNATRNYTLFARNPFLRWNGQKTIQSGETFWYGDDPTFLGRWSAGGQDNTALVSSGSFSGSFGTQDYPYVAALNATDQESLALIARNGSIDQYDAVEDSGSYRMGVSSSQGPVTVPYMDWWLGERGVQDFEADRMLNPPRLFFSRTEQIGEYFPSNGWASKITLEIEERNGTNLENYPVNVSINTGEIGVQEDCSDIVVVEDGHARPHSIRDQCDSVPFHGPEQPTIRVPMDESEGVFVNGTEPRFVGEIVGSYAWVLGEHDFGVDLQQDAYIDFARSPSVTLRSSSFVVSGWLRLPAGQDFGDRVSVLRYPGDAPSLDIVQDDGQRVLQARLMNDTEPSELTRVNGSTNITAGMWHHFAFRFDDRTNNVSLFLDGRLDGTGEFVGPLDQVANKEFTLGEGMDGALDEFKIYKRFLSDDTIRDQQQRATTLTFLTNLSAGRTERDTEVYADSAAGLAGDYTASELNLGRFGTATEPRVAVSQPRRYQEVITTFDNHIAEVAGLGERIQLTIQNQCTLLSYQTDSITLSKTVC